MKTSADALNEFLGLVNDNFGYLTIIVVAIILRKPLANLIITLKNFSFKSEGTKLTFNKDDKASRESIEQQELKKEEQAQTDDEPQEKDPVSDEQEPLHKLLGALIDKDFEQAEVIYERLLQSEDTLVARQRVKAIYFYYSNYYGSHFKYIKDLKELVPEISDEGLKVQTLSYLSDCLTKSNQINEALELCRSCFQELSEEQPKAKCSLELSRLYNQLEQYPLAIETLSESIKATKEKEVLKLLFQGLAKTHSEMGNNVEASICLDKAASQSFDDSHLLFSAAYDYTGKTKSQFTEHLSLINYLTLVNIHQDYGMAFNNLAVTLNKNRLETLAYDNYSIAEKLDVTLAMANKGYQLLEVGFYIEAKELAKKALEFDDPHKNVHKLLARIEEKKEEDRHSFEELKVKAEKAQKHSRIYVEQKYKGSKESFIGTWCLKEKKQKIESVDNENLKLEFRISDNEVIKLCGKVTGASLEGTYENSNPESPNNLLSLSSDYSKKVLGFVDPTGQKIVLFSVESNDLDYFEILREGIKT
ncbi:MAG: hypothetical protein ACQEVQ_10060 [Pseudomonadota bacterium]